MVVRIGVVFFLNNVTSTRCILLSPRSSLVPNKTFIHDIFFFIKMRFLLSHHGTVNGSICW